MESLMIAIALLCQNGESPEKSHQVACQIWYVDCLEEQTSLARLSGPKLSHCLKKRHKDKK